MNKICIEILRKELKSLKYAKEHTEERQWKMAREMESLATALRRIRQEIVALETELENDQKDSL